MHIENMTKLKLTNRLRFNIKEVEILENKAPILG